MIWEDTVVLITRHNIESLRHFKGSPHYDVALEVGKFVTTVLGQFPSHIGFPIKLYATVIGVVVMVMTRGRLNTMSPRRSKILEGFARYMPFFAILNKLIRALAFLNLFDHESVARTFYPREDYMLDE